jgi:hypothetical protein
VGILPVGVYAEGSGASGTAKAEFTSFRGSHRFALDVSGLAREVSGGVGFVRRFSECIAKHRSFVVRVSTNYDIGKGANRGSTNLAD